MWITFWEKQHSFVSLFIFSLWNDLLLSFVSQMELLDIYELSMLEQLPDEFNPPLFPYVGWTDTQRDTHKPPAMLKERAIRFTELHLPVSLFSVVCFFVLTFSLA